MDRLKTQGDRIKRARKYLLLSQVEFAEKLTAEGESFDDSKVSRIENGEQDTQGGELAAMSVILQQDIGWLAGMGGYEFKPPMGVQLSSGILVAA